MSRSVGPVDDDRPVRRAPRSLGLVDHDTTPTQYLRIRAVENVAGPEAIVIDDAAILAVPDLDAELVCAPTAWNWNSVLPVGTQASSTREGHAPSRVRSRGSPESCPAISGVLSEWHESTNGQLHPCHAPTGEEIAAASTDEFR